MKKTARGFSLIELLIAVAIIAILTAIGIAVFGSLAGNARDARRRADIDAMAKAYESNYDWKTGKYVTLEDIHFTSKKKPTSPEGGDYYNNLVDEKLFTVCAKLEGRTEACTDTIADQCYCQSSSLGDTASELDEATCPTFTFGQTCIVGTGSSTSPGSTIYIDCPTSLPAAHTTLDCSQQNSNIGHVALPFYNAVGVATPAGNSTFLFPAPPPPYSSGIWSVTVQKH